MPDRITELLARAWLMCDPNRQPAEPDRIMSAERDHLQPGSELIGKPCWEWFVPRAQEMRDFLSENGYVIRPKEKP